MVHTLWSYTYIKVVWNSDFNWVVCCPSDSESFSDVLQKIRAKLALVPLFATTAWSIWFQRNKSRHQDHPLPLHSIAGFVKNYLVNSGSWTVQNLSDDGLFLANGVLQQLAW